MLRSRDDVLCAKHLCCVRLCDLHMIRKHGYKLVERERENAKKPIRANEEERKKRKT